MDKRDAKRHVCAETAWWLETILPASLALYSGDDAQRVSAAADELLTEMQRRAGLGPRPVDERQLTIAL